MDYLISLGICSNSICNIYSGAAKAVGWQRRDIPNIPARCREDITAHRNPVSPEFTLGENALLYFFCLHTGIRRDDIEKLTGKALCKNKGTWYVQVNGSKGGKNYKAEIIGTPEEIAQVVKMFKNAGSGKLLPTIYNKNTIDYNFPVHALRGKYAVACYKKAAGITGKATINHAAGLSKKERYDCRNDYNGIHLVRKAIEYTTRNLGHNSLKTAVCSYLYGLVDEMREDEKARTN